MSRALRLAAVGHVTLDEAPGGAVPGGSVTYAARAWTTLGADVTVVTAGADDFPRAALDGRVRWQSAPRTTRFANTYAADGARRQRVLAAAPPVAPCPLDADAVFLAPVLGEVALGDWRGAPIRLRVGGLQGWLKRAVGDAVVHGPAGVAPAAFAGLHAACLSAEDLAGDLAWLDALRAVVPTVALTLGAAGCVVWTPDGRWRVPAPTVDVVDPTGAGDTFAAVFTFGLAAGLPATRAAARANALAAACVRHPGLPPRRGAHVTAASPHPAAPPRGPDRARGRPARASPRR
ncbi:MAG: sugar kinase [Myxococcales bacterium]|nr:sugar kinase [Myxococcales bacterium]